VSVRIDGDPADPVSRHFKERESIALGFHASDVNAAVLGSVPDPSGTLPEGAWCTGGQGRSRQEEGPVRRAIFVAVIALSVAAALLALTRCSAQQALAIGSVLVIAGVLLLLIARVQLGRAFSVRPKATTLVTRGLYSRIPHPMFVFLDVLLLGIVIATRQRWWLLPWLALVVVHCWEARRESKVLEKAFGEAYRKYRTQTWW
jgi:protein-S-isoprenylcysteine O-methyltransferase Ste14